MGRTLTEMGLLEKPKFGQPCNGCGLCCIIEQCPISVAWFGKLEPMETCPALARDANGKGFACGLIADLPRFLPDATPFMLETTSQAFAVMLGAGTGCDGEWESDTAEEVESARHALNARNQAVVEAQSPAVRLMIDAFCLTAEKTQ